MKKVFLRLVVTALIVALVVFVLINTVFKVESSIKTHDEIAKSLSANGEITRLNSSLKDNVMQEEYGQTISLINNEVDTLSHLYTKIIATKANSDSKTKIMLSELTNLKACLKKCDDKISVIEKSNPPAALKTAMVKELKDELNNSINALTKLNLALIEYLIDYYYSGKYDTVITLNYIKIAFIQKYFATEDNNALEAYKTMVTKCNSSAVILAYSKNYAFNSLLYNARTINIYKLITDKTTYVATLTDDQKITAEQMATWINTIAS